MSAFAARDPLRKLSTEMNITPLVDVMLVLLVIFMLAVPLPSRRIVMANAPACVRNCPAPPEPIRLAVKRTGELYWDGAVINRAMLAEKLAAIAHDPRERAVEVHVEGQAHYAIVTDVLAAAQNAGVDRIGIAPTRD